MKVKDDILDAVIDSLAISGPTTEDNPRVEFCGWAQVRGANKRIHIQTVIVRTWPMWSSMKKCLEMRFAQGGLTKREALTHALELSA